MVQGMPGFSRYSKMSREGSADVYGITITSLLTTSSQSDPKQRYHPKEPLTEEDSLAITPSGARNLAICFICVELKAHFQNTEQKWLCLCLSSTLSKRSNKRMLIN